MFCISRITKDSQFRRRASVNAYIVRWPYGGAKRPRCNLHVQYFVVKAELKFATGSRSSILCSLLAVSVNKLHASDTVNQSINGEFTKQRLMLLIRSEQH
jgi:hypothetical protein